jgi:hypothetical protein
MSKAIVRTAGVLGLALTGGVAVTLLGVGTATTPRAAAAPALDPFDDCAELRDWYVDAVLPEVGPWGLGDPFVGPYFAEDGTAGTPVIPSGAPRVEDAVGNGDTGTNVQEAGVDEPDVAKTNGEILVTVRGRVLVVFDVTGEEPEQVGRLTLDRELWNAELLLVGDRVVVISSTAGYGVGPIVLDDVGVPDGRVVPGYWSPTPRTVVTTVDLSEPADPVEVGTRTLEATFVSARQYGEIVRIVTSSTPNFDWVYPNKTRTAQEAKEKNRDIVRNSSAEDWLPRDAAANPIMDCTDVSRPDDSTALGTISIITMNPADPDSSEAIGVAADGDLVYSSTDRLYVATSNWGWSWNWGWGVVSSEPDRVPVRTDIHAFALDGADTSYVASGEVVGFVQDRWAFSEYDGNLRVASTKGNGSESVVSVLGEEGNRLRLLGSVGGLGENEDIKAVRWFGDIAVVVTFRTIDPLYTLDLSDPTDPQVVGELKIPGFSEYLHPVGGDILLGVGQHATNEGMSLGSQVSTFDLGDLADPQQVAKLRYHRSEYSPVQDDSRAFTYLPEHRIAFVPLGDWHGSGSVSVLSVGEGGTLEPLASLPVSSGWAESIRVLPLDADHVAIVANGEVDQIVDVTTL